MNICATLIKRALPLVACIAIVFSANALADDNEKPVPLTAEDVLKLLQDEHIITKDQAAKAANITKSRLANQSKAPVEYTDEKDKDKQEAAPAGVTRVPYIPKYIQDEIRDEVRTGLKNDVVNDVMAKAKNESWGVPGANPTWTKAIKFKGDIRFRYNGDRFDSGNSIQYRDFNAINAAGGTTKAGLNAFLNTTENRDRLRLRFRLGMDAKVTDGVTASMRIATGNPHDPTSTNQTLGGYGSSYTLSLDRAYIKFDSASNNYLMYFGRMPNPWLSTGLVWDSDLNFDGIAYSYIFNRIDDESNPVHPFKPFVTVGMFPLQEVALSKKDKWLFGSQIGFKYTFRSHSKLKMGLAYYNYLNITGIHNAPDSTLNNFTAPPFVQKGNTLYDISNSTSDPQQELWALAADFKELNFTTFYDIASFDPTHIILIADYVKNVGFDESKILARAGSRIAKKNTGYDMGVKVGSPGIVKKGDWNASLHYRYLERDAVLDAFTDSDFHLGGTDGKGYILQYSHAFKDNTWMQYELISSNSVSGPPLGTTTMFVDLNARF